MAADAQARAGGIRIGMSLADARARLPGLRALATDPERDRRAFERLAHHGRRFGPVVALDGEDGILVDVTGCASLFGGEEALRARAVATFETMGWTVSAAIATGARAASLWARFGGGGVLPEDERSRLEELPIAALGLGEELAAALRRLGLHRIGELRRFPRPALRKRFGEALTSRIEALFGHAERPPRPLPEPPSFETGAHLPEPTRDRAVIERMLRRALEALCRSLERAGRGVLRCELRLVDAAGRGREFRLDLLEPVRDPAFLAQLLRLRCESLEHRMPEEGIERILLRAVRTAPIVPRSGRLAAEPAEERRRAVRRLIERLRQRFGPDRVLRLVPEARFFPERAATAQPWRDGRQEHGGWFAPGPRPLRLFVRPQDIEVLATVPDGPPHRLLWNGRSLRILAAAGPERLLPEWWRDEDAAVRTRDYWRVVTDDGHELWLFREGLYGDAAPPRWRLHGAFDGALPQAGVRPETGAEPEVRSSRAMAAPPPVPRPEGGRDAFAVRGKRRYGS